MILLLKGTLNKNELFDFFADPSDLSYNKQKIVFEIYLKLIFVVFSTLTFGLSIFVSGVMSLTSLIKL